MFAHEELAVALETLVEARDRFRAAVRKVPDAQGFADRLGPVIADVQRKHEEITSGR